MTLPYQTDLKVLIPEGQVKKCTLALSPTGDIQLVDGHFKLVAQLVRAVINDQSVGKALINQKAVKYRYVKTLINIIARAFRQVQLDEVSLTDPDLSGFSIWRRGAGTTEQFTRISDRAQTWKFTDTGVNNGTAYEYGVSKVFKNIYETNFLETFTATPSSFASRQEIIIGEKVIALPESNQVTFYLDYNRRFKGSELVDSIDTIEAYQASDEPRQFIVNLTVKDLTGNQVSISNKTVKVG